LCFQSITINSHCFVDPSHLAWNVHHEALRTDQGWWAGEVLELEAENQCAPLFCGSCGMDAAVTRTADPQGQPLF
jgi:hypothetical protein